MIMEPKKKYYSWKQFDDDVKYLTQIIDKKIKCVCGIPKGGLVLAVKLSNSLEVPLYLSLNNANKKFKQNEILIVNDIVAEGETFFNLKLINNYKTLSLFIKDGAQFIPTYYSRPCGKNSWIFFPWDKN